MKALPACLGLAALVLCACSSPEPFQEKSIKDRVADRDKPSVFQAWYPIDMPDLFPLDSLSQRIRVAAKHDLLWEEPLSQLGEGFDLVLGLVWDHTHHGLATSFTRESLDQALENRRELLKLNPNMVLLLEVRWRDAPMSFLPENSDWWLRDEQGKILTGWMGGWEPFYKCNYEHPEFQDNIARQCRIAMESGVYDGVMFDWSGNLEIIKKTRAAIGDSALIIVNIHDDIEDGKKYAEYINGSFMELNIRDSTWIPVGNGREWDKVREALVWFEEHLQEPKINCLENWGDRDDLSRMRATTCLGLTHSDGYVLYADPNPLKTPDHLHDWYPFWDVELGKPSGPRTDREDGSTWREFEGGTVVYNHFGNQAVKVRFAKTTKRVSDGSTDTEFTLSDRDGDIFIPL
jgi:hypothetical protein